MKIRRLLRFALSGLLLTASTTAFAQITLSDGQTTKTWAQFADVINNGLTTDSTALHEARVAYYGARTDLANAKTALSEASSNYTLWNSKIANLQRTGTITKETAPWLSEAYDRAEAFNEEYLSAADLGEDDFTATAWYVYNGSTKLVLSFSETKPTTTPIAGQSWESINPGELYAMFVTDGKKLTLLYVDFGKNDKGNYNYTTSKDGTLKVTYLKDPETLTDDVVNAINSVITSGTFVTEVNSNQSQIDAYQKLVDNYDDPTSATGEAALEKAVSDAQATEDEKKTAFNTALSDYNTAVANTATEAAKYQEITLTGDVTANTKITKEFTGTIHGGGNIINVPSDAVAFSTFAGTLIDAGINGQIASSISRGKYENVAVWRGASNSKYYNADGQPTSYTTIGALGFAVRDNFGVDFANGGSIAKLDTDAATSNKVYNFTVYTLDNKTGKSYYAHVQSGKIVNTVTPVTIPTNMFAKSATEDVQGMNLVNVFYGDNNTCDLVNIEEKNTFFSPTTIDAKKVTYNRTLAAGKMNSVCLPFPLRQSDFGDDVDLCVYDREADGTFWFTKVGEEVPANTPAIVYRAEGDNMTFNLSNIDILPTPAKLIVEGEGGHDNNSTSYGTFKQGATAQEFTGKFEAYKIYGLNSTTNNFQAAGSNATFPAFRAVVYSGTTTPGQPANAPRRIGIVDEMGNILSDGTTAIENVATDNNAFDMVAGLGELTFYAEADFGKVEIYAIDGKLATVAEVVAGTTSVELPAGVYVVNGKKVLVK